MISDPVKDILTPELLIRYAERKGYRIFNGNNGNSFYDLNIWAIRNSNHIAGEFDDLLIVFWRTRSGWESKHVICTVDPSDHYLLNPIHKLGTAIIKPGQYRSVWQIGNHSGYEALVQRLPITVIRDFNRDIKLDFQLEDLHYLERKVFANKQGGHTTKWYSPDGNIVHIQDHGYFGIHLHRASKWRVLKQIGLYSAGCVVVPNINHYNKLMDIFRLGAEYWGNSFTFTLITEDDFINTVGIGKQSRYYDTRN